MLIRYAAIDVLVFRQASIYDILAFINYIFQKLALGLRMLHPQNILPSQIPITIELGGHLTFFPWKQLILSPPDHIVLLILLKQFLFLIYSHTNRHWH